MLETFIASIVSAKKTYLDNKQDDTYDKKAKRN